MPYERHDDKQELANYREDLAQEQEDRRAELAEMMRREWAQRHGNDAGFDPY